MTCVSPKTHDVRRRSFLRNPTRNRPRRPRAHADPVEASLSSPYMDVKVQIRTAHQAISQRVRIFNGNHLIEPNCVIDFIARFYPIPCASIARSRR